MRSARWLALVACAVVRTALAGSPVNYYVDVDATGPLQDGLTWCTAFRDLGDALALAGATQQDTILVAGGTYVPSPVGLADPRAATFRLQGPAVIRGGYAGCGAADPDLHDPRQFPTVLSGDLAANDHLGAGTWADNCCHVVTAVDIPAPGHRLEHVIVRGGNANDFCNQADGLWGGGLFCMNADPVLIGVGFIENLGWFGGAVFLNGAQPVFESCRFERNRAIAGGAVYDTGQSAPRYAHCEFIDNFAGPDGGALYIEGNIGPTLQPPVLFDCLFASNAASVNGGAIFTRGRDLSVTACTIAENTAGVFGGGLYAYEASVAMTDSIVWGNRDSNGAFESSQIFSDRSRIRVPDRTAARDFEPVINHSCIQGLTGTLGGTGNIGFAPAFAPGPAGCFYLDDGQPDASPCIDAGSDTAAALALGSRTTSPGEAADVELADLGYHHPITGSTLLAGDDDRDGDVDLRDAAAFQSCIFQQPLPSCCRVFDADSDGDADQVDWSTLAAFTR